MDAENAENPVDAKTLAERARVIAVVGASPDPDRPSYDVMSALVARGYDVIPVRPGCGSILGRPCVASIAKIDRPIDIVDVFRRPEAVPEVARQAAAVGAKTLWLQEGIVSPEARAIANEAGMNYVENRCLKRVILGTG